MLATLMIPVMNAALVVGVVLPRSLRAPFAPWLGAALGMAVSLLLPPAPLALRPQVVSKR